MSETFLKYNELHKILVTLFEPQYGLFYRRNYNINNNTLININKQSFGKIENILDESYIQNNMERVIDKDTYIIDIDKYMIILKKKLKKSDIEDLKTNNNLILINFENKKIKNKNSFYSQELLFNLTKNKYVPYIEIISKEDELVNIEKDKIAKIKMSDPLVKFYGFNKGDICKIIYKSNKINNIDLYFNYRIII
tara:strand:+ start:176 stop:760 length:585 start_codon:yes stop_codon:yes gene_type:complete